MLSPDNHRLDYGQQLLAPVGYELDAAIATTYSLDLNTLLTVPIALCFGDTLEGDIKGAKVALLHAVNGLEKRLKVFYQKGKIAIPGKHNQLFALLEPCLHPVIPQGGVYSSFHPKLWLIRYQEVNGYGVMYRCLVLSRNLTMDRSWDVAVSLDGKLQKKPLETKNNHWFDFIAGLLDQADDFEASAKKLKEELPRIVWDTPDNFDRPPEFMVGNQVYGCPVSISSWTNDQMMVVSPFISKEALHWLASYAPKGKRYLLSRADQLNGIGTDALSGWKCFSINENIVNGEERAEIGNTLHNLHAKIIITKKDSRVLWHIGSANATNAALGVKADGTPVNTEAMLKLSGVNSKVGPDLLLEQWVKEDGNGLFVAHEFQSIEPDENAASKTLMRETFFKMIKATWELRIEHGQQGESYDLYLQVPELEMLADNVDVEITQLASGKCQSLAQEMVWHDVKLTEISAFFPVSVTIDKGLESELHERFIIEAKLNFESVGGDDIRPQQVFKNLVDSKEKVLNYLSILLQTHPNKEQWLSFEQQHTGEGGAEAFVLSGAPIFEQLLWAASRHPHLLLRVRKWIDDLKKAEVDIPEGFLELWGHFEKEIPEV